MHSASLVRNVCPILRSRVVCRRYYSPWTTVKRPSPTRRTVQWLAVGTVACLAALGTPLLYNRLDVHALTTESGKERPPEEAEGHPEPVSSFKSASEGCLSLTFILGR